MTQQQTKNAAVMARQQALGDLAPMQPSGSYTFDDLYRLAQVLHASGMWEDTKDAAKAMVKILKGQEMGLPPTTAMGAFDIIQNKLFIKPVIIAAKINSCGYGSYRVTRQDAEACSILFRRKSPEVGWADCPPVTYTIQEAQAHKLVDRSAHWKANPAHMLYQRAMGRGGAMYFPELLAGLPPAVDDTPVSQEQSRVNVIALFGDQAEGDNGTAHTSPKNVTPSPDPKTTGEDVPQWYALLNAHHHLAKGAVYARVSEILANPAGQDFEGNELAMQLADLAAAGE